MKGCKSKIHIVHFSGVITFSSVRKIFLYISHAEAEGKKIENGLGRGVSSPVKSTYVEILDEENETIHLPVLGRMCDHFAL